MEVLSATAAIERLKEGPQLLEEVAIFGTLRLSAHDLGTGPIFLSSVRIDGDLVIENGELKNLFITGSIITRTLSIRTRLLNGLSLRDTEVGDHVDLRGSEIGGTLDLAGLKTPAIVLNEELAETVHWAAPATPLVVMRPALELATL